MDGAGRRTPGGEPGRAVQPSAAHELARPSSVWTTSASPTLDPMVASGSKEEYGSWKTSCILRRKVRRRAPLTWVMSSPPSTTRPDVGRDQAQQQSGQGRLARAALTDEPERPSTYDGKIHVIDGVHRSPAPAGKADREITGHADQLGHGLLLRRQRRGRFEVARHWAPTGSAPSRVATSDPTPGSVSSSSRRHRLWRSGPAAARRMGSLRQESSA